MAGCLLKEAQVNFYLGFFSIYTEKTEALETRNMSDDSFICLDEGGIFRPTKKPFRKGKAFK